MRLPCTPLISEGSMGFPSKNDNDPDIQPTRPDSPAARGWPGGETNRRTPLRAPDLLDDVEVVERRLAIQEAGPPLVCGFRLRQFGDLGGVVLGGVLKQL